MKKFLDEHFLLNNEVAQVLYHEYAKHMPIIDYHCHLSPKEIYENKKFESITQVWLGGDHYKWRLMRANGVNESFITGNEDNYLKFLKWSETLPYTLGNPLYHWSHLELRRFFNIDELISVHSAEKIYKSCNEMLTTDDFTPRRLMERSNVKVVCTTDDPLDTLEYHIKLKEEYKEVKVLPTFRPDKLVNIELEPFLNYIEKLSHVVQFEILDLATLTKAIVERINFFHEVGCRLSDHALDTVMYKETTFEEVDAIFSKRLRKETLTSDETAKYKGYLMILFGKEYAKRNWVMQLHIAALRNNNKRMFNQLGPDTGYDAMNESVSIIELRNLLDQLDYTNELPKTILYSLNPNDHYSLATLMGCYQDGNVKGKLQLGSAWWFNDHIEGMTAQIKALSNVGLLSRFVGMLTDSRSFLSYPRHEYFRRILCNYIGELVMNGEYPNDIEFLSKIVQDICYNNAVTYFNL